MRSSLMISCLAFAIAATIHAADEKPKKPKSSWLSVIKDVTSEINNGKAGSTSAASLGLSNDIVKKGLQEALTKGVRFAISTLGRADGFFKHETLKIPVPEKLQHVE